MKLIWRFVGWMIADIPSALRRHFWNAIIVGIFGALLHKITKAAEKLSLRVGAAA